MILKQGISGSVVEVVENDSLKSILKYTYVNPAKLEEQYIWLNNHKKSLPVPDVSSPMKIDGYYFSYKMPLYLAYKPLNEVLRDDKFKIVNFVEDMTESLKSGLKGEHDKSNIASNIVSKYFDEKIVQKIDHCLVINNSFKALVDENELIINQKSYFGLKKLIELVNTKKVYSLLCSRPNTPIHGDLTAENILINDTFNSYILLDPNPTNLLSNYSVEMAKIFQSLHSGYEFHNQLEVKQINKNTFEGNLDNFIPEYYIDSYKELLDYFTKCHGDNFVIETQLHECVHLSRLLPYKISKSVEDFIPVYLLFIMRLNRVLREEL